MKRPHAMLALAGVLLALLPGTGGAQAPADWPARPVTMVVPYPPGGVNDLVARAVADRMTQTLGKPVVIANRAGAATTVASNFAAKAAPDGYTIYAAGTSLVINPTLQGNVQYDAKRDFRPLSLMSVTPFVLHVHPALPVRDLAGLVAHARANPDKLNIASSGIGATNHMAAELLKDAAQIRLVHVPYKGGAQAGQDVAAGNAQMMFSAVIEAMPLIEGKLTRAIAVSSNRRSPALPDLPTIEEAGGPKGFNVVFWQAMVVPAATPQPIVDKLYAAIRKAVDDPELKAQFARQGVELRGSSPDELAALIDREEKVWSTLIREKGIKAE
ncbi:Bug family tripartite tricarboxylate transporter substrate binding protein [Stella sp.]|uniref:Bug family tripartite tricarboxylate transporter substrate binding protein n=1 Tax=Stella sp. TaxID=2912054 RepID=UPI0035AE1591